MRKLEYRNTIPVAAHRGVAKYYPENTMASFKAAVALRPDMIETDVHITSDGQLVLCHDHRLDRTTDGHGLIRETTLADVKKADAGAWKDEKFRGERVPLLEELLDLVKNDKDIMLNIELKDYPKDCGDLAYVSAEKTLKMLDEYKVLDRCVINSFSGELLEKLDEEYGDSILIHAYHPQEQMGPNQKRFVYDYAYCVCLFGMGDDPVVPKWVFDTVKSYGVEPWVYYSTDTPDVYERAIKNGAMLFTSNDPGWAMFYLRSKGLHE